MDSPTPPASPMQNSLAPPPQASPVWPRTPRSLPAGRGASWWGEGWRVFTAAPLLWIGCVVVMAIILIALGFIPLLGNVAQALLWPVFSGGLLLGCHALAGGRPLAFEHLFAGFRNARLGPLLILGVIAFAVGAAIAMTIMLLVFGALGFSGMAGFMTGDPAMMMGSAIAGMSIAALFAVPIALVVYALFMMAWWFAPALVALNRADPVTALRASFDASWKNLGAMLVYGLIFVGLAIVASIPFGLGWLVLGPVAIGASYAGWREIFGE